MDETKYTLTEHLTELRSRLIKSALGIVMTTMLCLYWAPELFDYATLPLRRVLREKNRIEAVVLNENAEAAQALGTRLETMPGVRLRAVLTRADALTQEIAAAKKDKKPIELVIASTSVVQGGIGALLEGVEPAPHVAYLVKNPDDPVVRQLELESATLVADPPKDHILRRAIRRAAADAGKSAANDKLAVLSPLDPFFAYLKISLVCGLFLACPIWLFQAWRFVEPGLYPKERAFVGPVIGMGSLLFLAGGLTCYYVAFPTMFDVLIRTMMPDSVNETFTADNYLSLLLQLTVASGVIFELPLAIALLAAIGIVSASGLRKWRKYWVIMAFVISAVITPTGDPLNLVMFALPLLFFYEIGIIAAAIMGRRRARTLALSQQE